MAIHLANFAGALHAKFDLEGNLDDLREAIAMWREAIDRTPIGHPDRAGRLSSLGVVLQDYAVRTRDSAVLTEARDCWYEAMSEAAAPVAVRIGAGRRLSVLAGALKQWPDAVDGYAATLELLPLLAWHGVSRASREHLLAEWSGYAVDAVSQAIEAEQPGRAVELLETGRGVLWSQMLALRTDLTDLGETHPALARRLELNRAALDIQEGRLVESVDQRMALAHERDKLIEQARKLDGSRAS
jgi:hypothetical protein